MAMALALPGTPNAQHLDYLKMYCQLGTMPIFARLQPIFEQDYFSLMSALPLALRLTEVIAIRLFGKTGPSCTTARLAIGMTAEKV